jgi:hypothetical protein
VLTLWLIPEEEKKKRKERTQPATGILKFG